MKLTKNGKPGNIDRRNPVINWKEFARYFLSIPMAHKMVTNYMILDNSSNNKMLKVMRPYQEHATQNILCKLRKGNQKIGYIWHTTGSGKTISSFKTAYLASRLCNGSHRVDKVVYLVDRLALTNQTANAYKAYDPSTDKNNNHGIVTGTTNVHDLKTIYEINI